MSNLARLKTNEYLQHNSSIRKVDIWEDVQSGKFDYLQSWFNNELSEVKTWRCYALFFFGSVKRCSTSNFEAINHKTWSISQIGVGNSSLIRLASLRLRWTIVRFESFERRGGQRNESWTLVHSWKTERTKRCYYLFHFIFWLRWEIAEQKTHSSYKERNFPITLWFICCFLENLRKVWIASTRIFVFSDTVNLPSIY